MPVVTRYRMLRLNKTGMVSAEDHKSANRAAGARMPAERTVSAVSRTMSTLLDQKQSGNAAKAPTPEEVSGGTVHKLWAAVLNMLRLLVAQSDVCSVHTPCYKDSCFMACNADCLHHSSCVHTVNHRCCKSHASCIQCNTCCTLQRQAANIMHVRCTPN